MSRDGSAGRGRAAFVFTPDRPFDAANVLLSLGALALFDAVAVLAQVQNGVWVGQDPAFDSPNNLGTNIFRGHCNVQGATDLGLDEEAWRHFGRV